MQKKTELQNMRQEELILEMASLKRTGNNPPSNSKIMWGHSRSISTEVQTSPDPSPNPLNQGNLTLTQKLMHQ